MEISSREFLIWFRHVQQKTFSSLNYIMLRSIRKCWHNFWLKSNALSQK